MGRTSRRVHVIDIEPGGPTRFVIGGPSINGKPLTIGQRFESRHDDNVMHLYEISSIDPKRARWIRAVRSCEPATGHPWNQGGPERS